MTGLNTLVLECDGDKSTDHHDSNSLQATNDTTLTNNDNMQISIHDIIDQPSTPTSTRSRHNSVLLY